MSESQVGSIGWVDLTCDNAEEVRDFYSKVVGWTHEEFPLDDGAYSDYTMHTADGEASSGICHKRGVNADIPSGWLIYIVVADLDKSMASCESLGGKILSVRKNDDGPGGFAIIEDPAGAVCAIYQSE